jgi:hypothetical protein
MFGIRPERPDHLAAEFRGGPELLLHRLFFDPAHHPHDVADAHPMAIACQAVAAARAANAPQDSGAHKLLHHLFEIAPRQDQASCNILALDWFGAAVKRYVSDRLERQNQFL